ncbi:MAG: sugar ABC transporter substrate-binding protein [Solirubrobacterales bacterium]
MKAPTLLLLLALGIVAAAVVAGCGSSSSSSSSSSESTTAEGSGGAETTAGEASGESSEEGGGKFEAIAGTEFVKGVPTLEELWEGEEEPPPKSGPPVKKNVSVVFVSCGQEAPGCSVVPNAMKEPAEKLGWDFRIIDGRLNVNNGWSNGVRQAIALKPDVIIIHGMNCPDVKQPLEEAKSAGIAVMGLEDVDCDSKAAGNEEKLFSVEMEYNKNIKSGEEYFYRWGLNEGAYAADTSEGKGKIILGSYQETFGKPLQEGIESVLDKCAECEVQEEIPFTAAEQVANGPYVQKFRSALIKNPEANVAMPILETGIVAGGIGNAVVEAGKAQSMVTVGAELNAPGAQLIEEEKGYTGAPAAHSPVWMAWGALDEINRYLNNQPAVPEGVGFVTAEKGHNFPPAGQGYETSYPYKEGYEELWGFK